MTVYLDTHVLVWLYAGDVNKLSKVARAAIEDNELVISPAAVLELGFLHEIGRLRPAASRVVLALADELGIRVCGLSFGSVVNCALKEDWVRDPFDRLIVANAMAADAPLVSKDRKILEHYRRAVW